MELFCAAETVRLRSHNNKFLCVKDDGRSVRLSREGNVKEAVWQVVCVSLDQRRPILKLKSRAGGSFLRAIDAVAFMRGFKGEGKMVVQCWSDPMDFSLDWEPLREGFQVRLKSRTSGGFLRAHGGPPPWRNAVTHDPILSKVSLSSVVIQQCFMWEVEPADAEPAPSLLVSVFTSLALDDQLGRRSSTDYEDRSIASSRSSTMDIESPGSWSSSTREPNERVISFTMFREDEESDEDNMQFSSITFQGNDLQDMTKKLEEATGLDDIVVCGKNPCGGEVFPLRLPLPPGNLPMSVVLVQSSSKLPSPSSTSVKPSLATKSWDEFARVKNMDFMGGARRIFKKALDWERPRSPFRFPVK